MEPAFFFQNKKIAKTADSNHLPSIKYERGTGAASGGGVWFARRRGALFGLLAHAIARLRKRPSRLSTCPLASARNILTTHTAGLYIPTQADTITGEDCKKAVYALAGGLRGTLPTLEELDTLPGYNRTEVSDTAACALCLRAVTPPSPRGPGAGAWEHGTQGGCRNALARRRTPWRLSSVLCSQALAMQCTRCTAAQARTHVAPHTHHPPRPRFHLSLSLSFSLSLSLQMRVSDLKSALSAIRPDPSRFGGANPFAGRYILFRFII